MEALTEESLSDLIERELGEIDIDSTSEDGKEDTCERDILSMKLDLLQHQFSNSHDDEDQVYNSSNGVDPQPSDDWILMMQSISDSNHDRALTVTSPTPLPFGHQENFIANDKWIVPYLQSIPDRIPYENVVEESPDFNVVSDIIQNLLSCIHSNPLLQIGNDLPPVSTIPSISYDGYEELPIPAMISDDNIQSVELDGVDNEIIHEPIFGDIDVSTFAYNVDNEHTEYQPSNPTEYGNEDEISIQKTVQVNDALEIAESNSIENLSVASNASLLVDPSGSDLADKALHERSLRRLQYLNEEVNRLKIEKCRIKIQAWSRGLIHRRKYLAYIKQKNENYLHQRHNSAILIQAWFRGLLGRRKYKQIKYNHALNQQKVNVERMMGARILLYVFRNMTKYFNSERLRKDEIAIMTIEDINSERYRQFCPEDSSRDHECKLMTAPLPSEKLTQHLKSLEKTWLDIINKSQITYQQHLSRLQQVYIEKKEFIRMQSNRKSDIVLGSFERYVNEWKSVASSSSSSSYSCSYSTTKFALCDPKDLVSEWREDSTAISSDQEPDYSHDRINHARILRDLGISLSHPLSVLNVSLTVEGISSMAFLHNYTNIQRLNLNVNKLDSLQGIESLVNIYWLSICDNKLTNIDELRYLKRLRYLYANNNMISDITPISRLSQLTTLALNGNNISSLSCDGEDGDMSVIYLPSLQRLELAQNKFTYLSRQFGALPSLTYLSLERNQIVDHDPAIFNPAVFNNSRRQAPRLRQMSGSGSGSGPGLLLLQTLILSHNGLTKMPSPMRLPLLRQLWITGNKITNLNAWVLPQNNAVASDRNSDAASGSSSHKSPEFQIFLPMIERIYLQDNLITDFPSGLGHLLPGLCELNVSFNRFTSLQDCLGLRECLSLQEVHLHENPLSTDTGNRLDEANTNHFVRDWEYRIIKLCPQVLSISGYSVDEIMKRYRSKPPQPADDLGSNSDVCDVKTLYKSFIISQTVGKGHRHLRIGRRQTQIPSNHSNGSKTANASDSKKEQSSGSSFQSTFRQFVDKLVRSQNSFKTFEAKDKRIVTNDKTPRTASYYIDEYCTSVYWEVLWGEYLLYQVRQILSFSIANKATENDSDILIWNDVYPSIEDDVTKAKWIKTFKEAVGINHMISQSAETVPVTSSATSGNTRKTIAEELSGRRPCIPLEVNAAVTLQSRWRSYHVRRRLNAALSSIRYVDRELDELFENDDHTSCMALLDDVSVMTSQFDSYSHSRLSSEPKKSSDSSSSLNLGHTFVYGDHRRPRNTNSADNIRPTTSQSDATSVSSLSVSSIQDNYRSLDYNNLEEMLTHSDDRNDVFGDHAIGMDRSGISNDTKNERKQQNKPIAKKGQSAQVKKPQTIMHSSGNSTVAISAAFGGRPVQVRTIRNKVNGKSLPAWALTQDQTASS